MEDTTESAQKQVIFAEESNIKFVKLALKWLSLPQTRTTNIFAWFWINAPARLLALIAYLFLVSATRNEVFIDFLEAYKISDIADRTAIFKVWYSANYLRLNNLSLEDWKNISYILFETDIWARNQYQKFNV